MSLGNQLVLPVQTVSRTRKREVHDQKKSHKLCNLNQRRRQTHLQFPQKSASREIVQNSVNCRQGPEADSGFIYQQIVEEVPLVAFQTFQFGAGVQRIVDPGDTGYEECDGDCEVPKIPKVT